MKFLTLIAGFGMVIALGALWMMSAASAADPAAPTHPRIVRPGETDAQPPSDAIVLFDGTDLSGWVHTNGQLPKWKIENGELVVAPNSGDIITRQAFGSCQLHIEWMTPHEEGEGQNVGNSGIKFQTHYEIQILESHDHATTPDGQAGSIYAQTPPLVNTARPPETWQSYDIIFIAPKRDARGNVVEPGRFTVLHNGVLIHHHAEILGKTGGNPPPRYVEHADRMPLLLQDHRHAVRFRNIWLREID